MNDYVQILSNFVNLKLMDEAQDPEKMILEIEHLNNQMKCINSTFEKTEMEMMIMLLAKLPDMYSEVMMSKIFVISTSTGKDVKKAVSNFYKWKFF